MELHYIDGSPFSRIVRVLALEHRLPVTTREITEFPPPPALQALNPMWQVPVLIDGDPGRLITPQFARLTQCGFAGSR